MRALLSFSGLLGLGRVLHLRSDEEGKGYVDWMRIIQAKISRLIGVKMKSLELELCFRYPLTPLPPLLCGKK